MGYQGSRGGGGRRGNDRKGGFRRKKRIQRKRYCSFCVDKKTIDYKEYEPLRRYTTEYGRIKARRQTGTCAKHQRELVIAIKRARHIALLPFVVD